MLKNSSNRISSTPIRLVILKSSIITYILVDGVFATHGQVTSHRGLELVFNLLGLVLDPEVSTLCLGALSGRDERLRGTAVEYLLNVLPSDIAAAIIEKVLVRVDRSTPPRPALELAQDLRASAAAIKLPTIEADPA